MASSNRHWPSMFKSKPCNSHLQWPHDVNSSSLLSSACQKTPYASAPGCEEKTPEPKPRWNPKPEQIKILEAIFNSGMVNPPRDEIRKIRAQLQEYGQVGDANVFYWFQNRKSRSKHKQRNVHASRQQSRFVSPIPEGSSSSSSSSERSTGSEKAKTEAANPKADSFKTLEDPVKKSLYPEVSGNFCDEPFFFSGLSAADLACFVGVPEGGLGLCHGLFTDLMNSEKFNKIAEEDMKVKMHLHHGYFDSAADITSAAAAKPGDTVTDMIQGIGTYGARSTVFINGVAFDVGMGLVNLREAFGENAVLLHSSGLPVLVDDWGVTLHPLQHGASYYLI